jgi:hypothetical protein
MDLFPKVLDFFFSSQTFEKSLFSVLIGTIGACDGRIFYFIFIWFTCVYFYISE